MTGKIIALRRTQGVAAEMSDEALLAACSVGDSAALGALFDRYHADVHRFLGRLAGADARDMDDLLQATFLDLQRSARRFEGRSSVRTWIFGVAAHVVRHHARGEARRRAVLVRYGEEPTGHGAPPDELWERRRLLARVARAVEALPHDLRVAFVMCDLEGVAGVEVARALGLREGTLWRRLHDARKRLRASIEEGSR